MKNVHKIKSTQKKDEKLAIILLYSGDEKRLRGPRPLLDIGGKKLFEHHLSAIEERFQNESHQVIAITGYESNRIMAALPTNIIKIENENFKVNNVSRSIGIALRATDLNNVLVIYGDLFFNRPTLSFSLERSATLIDSTDFSESQIGCTISNGQIEMLMYDLPKKWGEMIFFRDHELDLLKKIVWDDNKRNLFGFEIINEIISKGGSFAAIDNPHAKFCDIDCQKQLQKIKDEYHSTKS